MCELQPFDNKSQFLHQYTSYAHAAVTLGFVDTPAKLSYHVARHCKYIYASTSLTQAHVDEISASMLSDSLPQVAPDPHVRQLDMGRATAMAEEASAALPAVLHADPSQENAYAALARHDVRGLHIITGGPSCGMSVLARRLIAARAVVDGVVCMASTNSAAHMLSSFADTAHAMSHSSSAVDMPYLDQWQDKLTITGNVPHLYLG